jgi:hypothetical protein|tara:strand:- start:1543 stop:1911 length:369 start_codon:yes stop_codon:yes gene_type:complete
MALDFGGGLFGAGNEKLRFDLEKEDILMVNHDFSGVGEETAYTVTTGKTYWITEFILINGDSADDHDWTLKLDDSTFYLTQVASKRSHEIKFDIPVPLTSAKTIKATAGHADGQLIVVGFEK